MAELTAHDFRERARRVREEWIDVGVQIDRLEELRESLERDWRLLEHNAEKRERMNTGKESE